MAFEWMGEKRPQRDDEPTGPSKKKLNDMLAEAARNTGAVPAAPQPRANEDRRFTDKASLDPGAVRSLPRNHPALVENRALFPSTVVDVTDTFQDRLLVSGKNNRKLGEAIQKGQFKGYALYGLSLEERATCPTDCDARAYCYGNGMQFARRHRITDMDVFYAFLQDEIRTILADPIGGLMVRLHVLGDFPSVEYVAMWSDLLSDYDRLACYGYTHRHGDDIGKAIDALKGAYPDRFRIRWSSATPMPDGATVIGRIPEGKRVAEGIVCPAQTDATACCATCGLCWEGYAKKSTIVFIKHGPKSLAAAIESAQPQVPVRPMPDATPVKLESVRPIEGLKIPQRREPVLSEAPEVRLVEPSTLKVEPAYQRDLSSKSMKLIRKIVTGWDWAKYKPPVCAETDGSLFIIDGQHTAIAAASHPAIEKIPVMVVAAGLIERRAEAFVSHNRDRLTMTPAQVFYGDVAAGNKEAKALLECVTIAGGSIPRLPVPKGYAKQGQITAVGELRKIFSVIGAKGTERLVRIAVLSRLAPVSATIIIGLRVVLTEEYFEHVAALPDAKIAAALGAIKNIEATSQHYAAESGQSRYRAAAALIAAQCAE